MKLSLSSIFDSVYRRLLDNESMHAEAQGIRATIHKLPKRALTSRDLCRTFEETKLRTKGTQEKLENVLTAVALVHPNVGYYQDMNCIAAEVFNVVGEEELAFWLFVGLMEKHPLFVPVSNFVLYLL